MRRGWRRESAHHHGETCGTTAPTTCHARDIYADSLCCRRAATTPDRCEADERGGDAGQMAMAPGWLCRWKYQLLCHCPGAKVFVDIDVWHGPRDAARRRGLLPETPMSWWILFFGEAERIEQGRADWFEGAFPRCGAIERNISAAEGKPNTGSRN